MADQISSRPARTADGVRRAHFAQHHLGDGQPACAAGAQQVGAGANGCGRPAGATASSPFHPGHRPRSRRRSSNRCPPPAVRPARRRPGTACHWNARLDRAQQAAEIEQMRLFLEIDDVGPGERQAQPLADPRQARLDLVRVDAVGQAAFQAQHHGLVGPCPCRSRPASRTARPARRARRPARRPHQARGERLAAIIGPTVCELEGPMPILNRSKALTFIWRFLRPRCGRRWTPVHQRAQAADRTNAASRRIGPPALAASARLGAAASGPWRPTAGRHRSPALPACPCRR